MRFLTLIPMLILFGMTLVSLYFMGTAAQNSDRFSELYIVLLVLNTILLLVLLFTIASRLLMLVINMRKRLSGARLTWRLVLSFILVAIIPVGMVYAFSIKFLGSSIDSWFDVKIEHSLEDALELSQLSFDYKMREQLLLSEDVVHELTNESEVVIELSLNDYRRRVGALEMTLLGRNNRIIASSIEGSFLSVPKFPSEDILFFLAQGENYVGLEPAGKDGFRIRTVASFPSVGPLSESRVLVSLFPVSGRMSDLADRVQQAFGEYGSLDYLRSPLKKSFMVTLFLVLLLGTLFAIWAAFAIAGRMLSPIIKLAEATQAVSKGDYSKKIPVEQHDELGFLVQSFNEMTVRVDQARQAAELSQNVAEGQRSYLQAVLGNLSSGVLTIDASKNLRTVNEAASALLESTSSLQRMIGRPLKDLCAINDVARSFCGQIKSEIDQSAQAWEKEIKLFGVGGRKILICRGIKLLSSRDKDEGQIIMFEDITSILSTQRDAAWGEVARRWAHEIKIPLTPIQLSAERLEHKLQSELGSDNRKILKRSIHTIVQQVEAMKSMVNEFRDYADSPQPELDECDLNKLIASIYGMYTGYHEDVAIEFEKDNSLPLVVVDEGRIRQVIHNLIKNAFEAIGDMPSGEIIIKTRLISNLSVSYIEIVVRDNGSGISPGMIEDLFEPYVTNKQSGTGLGLAIVKKIIEEHGGMVMAINNKDSKGASITLRLPAERDQIKLIPEQPGLETNV